MSREQILISSERNVVNHLVIRGKEIIRQNERAISNRFSLNVPLRLPYFPKLQNFYVVLNLACRVTLQVTSHRLYGTVIWLDVIQVSY